MTYRQERKSYRIFEFLPGLLAWAILLLPVILSPFHPRFVVFFIFFYITLWLIRSFKFNLYALYSFYQSKVLEREDWQKRLNDLPWQDIYHVVIIATYKESFEILRDTINSLKNASYPLDKIFLVIAAEERDKTNALQNIDKLKKIFSPVFAGFYHYVHLADVPGEIPGKGSNISFAAKKFLEEINKRKINHEDIIVTTLDADNHIHPLYFSVLTYKYLVTPDRQKHSYQPFPLFDNNIWNVPLLVRLASFATSFWQMAQCVSKENLMNASSHAQPLRALVEMDFWSKTSVTEDTHQFWRSFFHFRGDYKVVPLFIPMYQDAVLDETYWKTLVSQYFQLRRWSFAVKDISYIAAKFFELKKSLPIKKCIFMFRHFLETYLMWSTAPFIASFLYLAPYLLNQQFRYSLFAYNTSKILSFYFLFAFLGVLITMWSSLLILPKHPRGMKFHLISVLQWILLPVFAILYALPALETQTRLMFKKYLSFDVTLKYRIKAGVQARRQRISLKSPSQQQVPRISHSLQ